jgi:crotonobetainyl-CoA:carnitine CoA-transferase CaiB-like acyl-CoA transferase
MIKPLEGIRVIACEHFIAGPMCTMLLGDMGADVIRVEPPEGDVSRGAGPPFVDGQSVYYLSVNRSKRAMTLNLRTPEGVNILKKLIEGADVVVENYRAGVMARLGLSYKDVSASNPRIIYCSISGHGQDGPLKDKAGLDAIIQGEWGFMDITGFPDGPPVRAGFAISDNLAGVYAVQGILLALIARGKTGRGQYIDIALADSLVSFLTYQAGYYFATKQSPKRIGNCHAMVTPYENFTTKDGHVIIAAATQKAWEKLCTDALMRPELIEDARFVTMSSRKTNQPQLRAIIEESTVNKTTAEWIELLEKLEIPCGRVRTVGEVLEDENVKARKMVVEVPHPTAKGGKISLLGNPIKLSDTPGEVTKAPPLLGQHTEEVLTELGLTGKEITELKERKVI